MGRLRIPPRNLPQNLHPVGWRCVTFMIPDDDEYEHIAYSTLYDQLALTWTNWKRTGDDTGSRLCRLWRAALATWKRCEPPPTMPQIGADSEDFLIRQNPDNPCQLQSSVDGATWCTFADFALCVAGSLQSSFQPGPQEQPPAGGCSEFDVTLNANNVYLSAIGVGAGDTVTITNLTGGWLGAPLDVWRCPTGQEYVLGACFGSPAAPSGSDKCPSIGHMKLIANDGTNCYDASSGSFTIDSGIPNGTQLTFQANDADLTDNAGSASFHVKICKNAVPTTLYYGVCTNFWTVEHLPSQITWTPVTLGVPTTVTSPIPADPSHPDNVRAYFFLSYASSFDSTNFAVNSSNIWYKLTDLSVSGATFDSGNIYAQYNYGSGCTGTGTAVSNTPTPPTVPGNLFYFEIVSHTQFIVNFTAVACS